MFHQSFVQKWKRFDYLRDSKIYFRILFPEISLESRPWVSSEFLPEIFSVNVVEHVFSEELENFRFLEVNVGT